MGPNTFDLVETISDLLKRIDEGRKTVRETQKVSDDFLSTVENREKAFQLLRELRLKVVSPDEPAQSQAKAELDRQVSEYQKLNDESTRLWLQLTETIAFSCGDRGRAGQS
jgi:predicted nuclease with TOPRIM domain